MQFPITLGLHRSFFLVALLSCSATLGALSILLTPWEGAVQAVLILAMAMFLIVPWRLYAQACIVLRLGREGEIWLADQAGGEFLAAQLLPGATVHPWLTVFRLRMENGRIRAVIIARDSLSPDEFRRLRVFLRWKAVFNALPDAA